MLIFFFEKPNAPEQLKPALEEIISTPTGNDFIAFEIKDIAPIAVAKKLWIVLKTHELRTV